MKHYGLVNCRFVTIAENSISFGTFMITFFSIAKSKTMCNSNIGQILEKTVDMK